LNLDATVEHLTWLKSYGNTHYTYGKNMVGTRHAKQTLAIHFLSMYNRTVVETYLPKLKNIS